MKQVFERIFERVCGLDVHKAQSRVGPRARRQGRPRKRTALGHGRALGAIKHSMICACWHMLSPGELYDDLGGDYYSRRDPERQTRRLVAQLERLGHTVTLQEASAA